MPRALKETRIDTREARLRLAARSAPYWRQVSPGVFLGYRRAPNGAGRWIARTYLGGARYAKQVIAAADDRLPANGREVLDYRQALDALRELTKGRGEPVAAPLTVAEAVERYLAQHEGRSAHDTRRKLEAHVLPELGALRLDQITRARLVAWRKAIAEAPKMRRPSRDGKRKTAAVDLDDSEAVRARRGTANRLLRALKAVLNFAFREGWVGSDGAWRRVPYFSGVDAARPRVLTADESRRLLNACDPDFRRIVHGALLTGMRWGSLTALEVQDYHAEAQALVVRRQKTNRAFHIPLTDEGCALFDELTAGRGPRERMFRRADGSPWLTSHQIRRMREACARAELEPIGFHGLRHTTASLLIRAGVPLKLIAQALGLTSTRMLEAHYGHLFEDHYAAAIRAALPTFVTAAESPRRIDRLRVTSPLRAKR